MCGYDGEVTQSADELTDRETMHSITLRTGAVLTTKRVALVAVAFSWPQLSLVDMCPHTSPRQYQEGSGDGMFRSLPT
jgi:hypothetical protein